MKSYTLGDLMHFEAENPTMSSGPGSQRLYIDECFMTASSDPDSMPKYTIIENYG